MLKASDPEASITLVWRRDSAVDRDASEIGDDYITASIKDPLLWQKRLKMKDGAKPTEFVIGITPPTELNLAEDMHGIASKSWHVFIHSVRKIKNANGMGDAPTVTRNGVEYVDPEWLARTMVRGLRQCANEIGLIAFGWNNMSEDDGKN